MSATLQIPSDKATSQFLTQLYGTDISAAPIDTPANETFAAVAEYVNADGKVCWLAACDLAAAAKLGAALTMIPAGATDDAIESGTVPENLAENLGEVFNIMVSLFMEEDTQRLTLRETKYGVEAIAMVESHTVSNSGSFTLDIQRYGKGNLSFLSVS